MGLHLFKLSQQQPHDKAKGGFRIKAYKKNFPILRGMSLYKLVLHPKGLREPHWHANADELGYCLKGQVLVSLYNNGDTRASFLVQEGEVFLIPTGALHGIENAGATEAELLTQFSSEDTEDFNLSNTLNVFSNAVLGNTWGVKEQELQQLKRSKEAAFASTRKSPLMISDDARYDSPYRFNLEKSEPLLTSSAGSARMARQNVWPIAKHQAVYSLKLTKEGMREPHWHPDTAELGYVAEGQGRMSVFSPSGDIDTYVMEKGDIYFIPKAYPHHIENLQEKPLHLVIFFNQGMPGDIAFTGSVRSFSNEVLGSITKTDPKFFNQLEKRYTDAFIVKRINPIEK